MVSARMRGHGDDNANINLNQTQSVNIWKLFMDREQYTNVIYEDI